jgi:hypothetical protein
VLSSRALFAKARHAGGWGGLTLAAFFCSPAALGAQPPTFDRVEVRAAPVPLNPENLTQGTVGRLRYRGGVHLTCDDKRFGGWSSLRLAPDGKRITLLSDEGVWLTALLQHEKGLLTGLAEAELGPVVDLEGKPLVGKDNRDGESLARMPDGSFVIGFERLHRLWRYGNDNGRLKGPAVAVPSPPGLSEAPFNGGIESLVWLPRIGLFALTEYWIHGDLITGWIGGPDDWQALGYRFERALRPSDAAVLPWGDLIVLERAYNPDRGVVGVRLRQIAREALKPGAALGGRLVADLMPPLTLDNFEGIDCLKSGGETICYVVSDDNLSKDQRTLLLQFVIEGR